MAARDCLVQHKNQKLIDDFDNKVNGGMDELQAAREVVLSEHKSLHDRVNNIKTKLNEKLDPKDQLKVEPYNEQGFPQQAIDDINKKAKEEERKVTRTKILSLEPAPDKKGRTPVTLSGNTEKERQSLIKKRKADTYAPSKIIDEQKLLERVNRFNKQKLTDKRNTLGRSELNNIKLAVDSYNNTYNQKYTAVQNRAGDIEFRNTNGDKVKVNNKAFGDLSIDEKGVPLMQRDQKTKEVFADLLDLNLFPTGYTDNGKRMTESQLDGAIQDILDGIPSKAANNYLDALEKMIAKDDFDFSQPGIPQQERITLDNILETEIVQEGEQMTEEGINQMLDEQSQLTPEQEETINDNLETLIDEYDIIGDTGQVQTTPEEGEAADSGETKQDTQPENAPSETATSAEDKFNEKVDRMADAPIDFLTPNVKIEGLKKSGIGIPEIVRAGAEVIKAAYKISNDIGQAISEGIKEMKKMWTDAGLDADDFPESGLEKIMNKEFADLKQKKPAAPTVKKSQLTKEDEIISTVLSTSVDEKKYPTIFENNVTKKQVTAVTQGKYQQRVVDGDYVVALQSDLRDVSLQSVNLLKNALGANWGERTLRWIEQHPSEGDLAQIVGVLNVISNENYQDIQDTHDSSKLSKLYSIQKRIDVATNKNARIASLALNQRRLYQKFAQGGNMQDVLTNVILSPEMLEMQEQLEAILSEEHTDAEINAPQPMQPVKQKKQSLIKKITSRTKLKSNPAIKDDLKTKGADVANKTGKSFKELIDEANAKIKNIKC